MNEPDLDHHFAQNASEFEKLAKNAERIRRHYLWMMVLSLTIFLFVLALLLFAVPNYIQNITAPNG